MYLVDMSYTKSGNSWVLAVVVFERSWERSTAQNNLHISRSRCRISRRSVRPPTRPHSPLSIVACTVWHARCQNGPAGTITTPSPSCLRPPPQGYWDGPSGQISRPARPPTRPVPVPVPVPVTLLHRKVCRHRRHRPPPTGATHSIQMSDDEQDYR